jgi:micrococcal nuclease
MKRIIFLFLLMFSLSSFARAQEKNPCYPVQRVIDGDTIEILLKGEPAIVRLIGVDAPELTDSRADVKPLAENSKKYLTNLLANQCVEVLTEENNKFDKYGHYLAYVYLSNKKLVNLEIIKEGYAWALTKYPFLKRSEFLFAEADSRNANIGLWSIQAFHKLDGINPNDIDTKSLNSEPIYNYGQGYQPIGSTESGSTSGKSAPGKDVKVRSYTRKDGTQVQSHTRSAPGRKN